ncbi:phage holin family protein [Nocardioides sp. AE5]|uniref:phage holin family protein n=1 Tax=Nocardioides sp. AE5 TaxID=2962573 RepID=UPI002881D2C4|nr:phage holin family protein [Nocardioides sp. AE5]MDT0200532.1 phage holin family protein [Nocardioides sp. AE5]
MSLDEVKSEEPTIGKLVADAQRDISSIISNEIKLAKSELKVSIKAGGTGAAMFAAAGFIGVLAIIIFSIFLAHLIHWNGDGLDLHWAYLIVFAFYVLLAGILVFIGIRQVKRVKGPEKAIHHAQETKAAITNRG